MYLFFNRLQLTVWQGKVIVNLEQPLRMYNPDECSGLGRTQEVYWRLDWRLVYRQWRNL